MKEVTEVTRSIIGAAIEVHNHLGPGLLESVYEICLGHELRATGFSVERQRRLPLVYKGVRLEKDHFLDLIVDDSVIIEVKAVADNHSIHQAQLLTYLRLSGLRHGLVINFGLTRLVDGVSSVINGYDS